MAPPLPNLFSTQVEEYRALKDLWMPPASSGQLASAAFPTPPGPRGSLRQHRPTPGISGTSAAALWHRKRAPTAAKELAALQMKTKRLEFHLEPAGSERRAAAVT
ncbi:hypothetical protein AV530_003923 [Patagioenas fasciata monilis]|uniref:Uncharacterized protein n=1 Tax=Patagioenas fasciata monilis TaxID=372326 RepID=A0A1V4KZF0_PATFA|nr:hypothetical protein AV530_003923 [Patagioenas fasciata monilis]